jgi:hypothetical protein
MFIPVWVLVVVGVLLLLAFSSRRTGDRTARPEPATETDFELDFEPKSTLTHTELVVEFYAWELLDSAGYAPLRDAIVAYRDRDYPNRSIGDDPKWPGLQQWQFIFFGETSADNTIVWSSKYKTMLSDRCLIFEQLWQEVLEGQPEAKSEPFLVLDLDPTHSKYRMYLYKGPLPLHGLRATMLCEFPVALLKDLEDKDREVIAGKHGLRVVEQVTDVSEDAFGEPDIFYPDGKEYSIYEFEQLKIIFKVHHYWHEPPWSSSFVTPPKK